jgi:hypothetical protein
MPPAGSSLRGSERTGSRPLASDVHSFIHAKFLPTDWVRGRKPSNDLASLVDIADA